MKIAIFGTGMVGDTIGSKLVELGHNIMMGSRTSDNEKAKCLCCKTKWQRPAQEHLLMRRLSEKLFLTVPREHGSVDAFKMAGREKYKRENHCGYCQST